MYYDPLPTPEEMAAWDRAAIQETGIPEEMLMENASREAMDVLLDELGSTDGSLPGLRVLLLAGSGNNGGDAIALARHLRDRGAEPLVLLKKPQSHYKGAAGRHLRLAKAAGVALENLSDSALERAARSGAVPDVVVDGLLGTGFTGSLRQDYLSLVRTINDLGSQALVLALDVPSGLDATTGRPSPEAVAAHATVTFEAAKLGLVMPGAEEYTGALHVRRIGIPRAVREARPAGCGLLTPAVADLLPRPSAEMHKGSAGHVLVAGGSPGLTGAPLLAGLGALRSGAGLATVAAPGALCARITAGWPDVMTLPLGDGETWHPAQATALSRELPRFDALVMGPGLGRNADSREFLKATLDQDLPPAVLDADALYWLAEEPGLFTLLRPGSVLTPHPGEMARLLDTDIASVQSDRLGAARSLAERCGCVVVLKGAGTVVAAGDGPALLAPFAAPCLATGGAGDVLSGVVARFLAQGLQPLDAACLGVYLHGFCGLLLEDEFPARGNLAQEIAHTLPTAMEELLDAES